jgi:hypothetical protein
MKRFGLFFIVGTTSTALLAFAASKMSHYLIGQWKEEGGLYIGNIGIFLEHMVTTLTWFAHLMLPSSTSSLAVVLFVLVVNFSLWGAIVGFIGCCLTSRSRPTR